MGRILILYDNRTEKDSLIRGWGFSALIECNGQRIIFDAGADRLVMQHNARVLDVDLSMTDGVVFSHEHCDHIGGMFSVLSRGVSVFCPASFSNTYQKAIHKETGALHLVSEPSELSPGIFSTGVLGTKIKEQALIVEGGKGSILVTGCAHPGIVKICEAAQKIAGTSLQLVLGGFHFYRTKKEKVKDEVEKLKGVQMEVIAPCHCTGDHAMTLLRRTFDNAFLEIKAGTEIAI
jgi:7,8-dihydropterin-6-yl-methyl-4-(beta-D-ribofuranosyl)aminobenzene 5'-phosphate synthase